MNGLDIALVVVLLYFFLRGIFRGFIREITGVIGLVAGFALAGVYFPVVARALQPFIHNTEYRKTIGFLALYLAIFMVISLLGLILDKMVKLTLASFTNNLLGAITGLVKGLALSIVVLMVTTVFIRQDTSFYRDSVTWPYLKVFSDQIKELAPKDLKDALEKKSDLLPDDLKIPSDDESTMEPPPWKPVAPTSDETGQPAWPGTAP